MSSNTADLIAEYPETSDSALSRTAKNWPLATANEARPDFSAMRRGTVESHDQCKSG